tara:strand:+ start:1747 stop:1884 length:138 start_codon:yes stop_codon:yes gene_type:complete
LESEEITICGGGKFVPIGIEHGGIAKCIVAVGFGDGAALIDKGIP